MTKSGCICLQAPLVLLSSVCIVFHVLCLNLMVHSSSSLHIETWVCQCCCVLSYKLSWKAVCTCAQLCEQCQNLLAQVTFPSWLHGDPDSAEAQLTDIIRACLHVRLQDRWQSDEVHAGLHQIMMQYGWCSNMLGHKSDRATCSWCPEHAAHTPTGVTRLAGDCLGLAFPRALC